MRDPVVVVLPRKGNKADLEQVVEREYAEANKMKILEDAPLYQHGRLRGVTRKDGRPMKPVTDLASIPASKTTSKPADGEPDGGSAVTPQEAKK